MRVYLAHDYVIITNCRHRFIAVSIVESVPWKYLCVGKIYRNNRFILEESIDREPLAQDILLCVRYLLKVFLLCLQVWVLMVAICLIIN